MQNLGVGKVKASSNLPVCIEGNAFLTLDSGRYINDYPNVQIAIQCAKQYSKKHGWKIRIYQFVLSEIGQFSGWALNGIVEDGKKIINSGDIPDRRFK